MTQTTIEQPVADLDRLRRALANIDADPSAWNQSNWYDCVAGIVVHEEEGGEFGEFDEGGITVWLAGELVSISDAAQRLLGLTDLERDLLFAGGNSRQALQQVAELVAGQVGEPL
jgi:hypothetical protein